MDTLAKNGIAMELNNRRRLPIGAFLDLAKHAGVTFTCGTNNAGASDLGRNEFCAEMITAHGLGPQHFWTPPSDGAKAVQRPPLLKQPARARRYALR